MAVARTDFVQQNLEAEKFLEEYSSSVTYVTEQNDAAAELVGNYDIVTAEVAKKRFHSAISPFCPAAI